MRHLLLVDDSPIVQSLIQNWLGQMYRICVEGTLTGANKRVEKERFDLILLDLTLPEGDGFQVCVKARNSIVNKETPVIFLTARADIESKLMAFSVGGDDFVTKPFDILELQARVDAKLRRFKIFPLFLKSGSRPGTIQGKDKNKEPHNETGHYL